MYLNGIEVVMCTACCWNPFCPDHRLRQDADGARCPECKGTGRVPKESARERS